MSSSAVDVDDDDGGRGGRTTTTTTTSSPSRVVLPRPGIIRHRPPPTPPPPANPDDDYCDYHNLHRHRHRANNNSTTTNSNNNNNVVPTPRASNNNSSNNNRSHRRHRPTSSSPPSTPVSARKKRGEEEEKEKEEEDYQVVSVRVKHPPFLLPSIIPPSSSSTPPPSCWSAPRRLEGGGHRSAGDDRGRRHRESRHRREEEGEEEEQERQDRQDRHHRQRWQHREEEHHHHNIIIATTTTSTMHDPRREQHRDLPGHYCTPARRNNEKKKGGGGRREEVEDDEGRGMPGIMEEGSGGPIRRRLQLLPPPPDDGGPTTDQNATSSSSSYANNGVVPSRSRSQPPPYRPPRPSSFASSSSSPPPPPPLGSSSRRCVAPESETRFTPTTTVTTTPSSANTTTMNGGCRDVKSSYSREGGGGYYYRELYDLDDEVLREQQRNRLRSSSTSRRHSSPSRDIVVVVDDDVVFDGTTGNDVRDDNGWEVGEKEEDDDDDGGGSKKSKVSSDRSSSSGGGLLSRASRKIKKRLIAVGGGGGKKMSGGVKKGTGQHRTEERRRRIPDDRKDGGGGGIVVVPTSSSSATSGGGTATREGRDPSPSRDGRDRRGEEDGDAIHSNHGEGVDRRSQHRHPHRHRHQQWHDIRQRGDGHRGMGKDGSQIAPSSPPLDAHRDDIGVVGGIDDDDDYSSEYTHDASTLTTNITPLLSYGGGGGYPPPSSSSDRPLLLERVERYLATPPILPPNEDEDGRAGVNGDGVGSDGSSSFQRDRATSLPRLLELQRLPSHEQRQPCLRDHRQLSSLSSSKSMDTMGHRPSSKDSKVRERRLAAEQGMRVENASAISWERDEQSEQCQADEFLQNHIGEIKNYSTHDTTADDYDDGDSTTTDNGPKSFAEKSNASHSTRHSSALSSSKHKIEGVKSDEIVFSKLQRMKERLSEQEEEMEGKVSVLEHELRKQEKELRDMGKRDEKFKAKEADYVFQLAADLEAYKDECASYRDRILLKEREVANMESLLYEERKKVLSLESENKILLNVADDNVCNSMDDDRARTLELTAYREQCDKYRQHVLELTRNALTAEEALEATGHVALAYEEEKKSLIAQLEQVNSSNISHESMIESLRSKLENEEYKTKTLEAELSTLKSRCDAAQTDVVDAKRKADEDRKSMSILESENAALLQKLNDSNTSSERLQTIANQCIQTEEENNLLRKRNDELLAKQIEMSKEVHDARGLSSNSTRLQKIMSENECYISKLQDDLSKARAVHLESLQTTRQKYSDEIDSLTQKLTCEKQSRRMAEIKSNELEDKCLSMERKLSDLQNVGTHQTKAQDDQVMKLMQHADDLRKNNVECRDEYASLEREMSDKNHANELIIKELQSKLTLIEEVNSKMSEDLANVSMEILLTRESKMKEVDDLIQIIREKDCALLTLRSEISEVDAVKASDTERLKGIIQRLEQDLEGAKSSNSSMKKRLYKIKQHSFDVMNSMRIEKMTLLSDVQNLILNERVALMKQAKEIACAYGRKVESHLLACSMNHSVAMSAINLKKSDMECLLKTISEKRHHLEKSLERTRNENQALLDILDSVCVKLSAKNKDSLVDSIDEFLLDRSETTIQIRTLEVDMKSLASHNAHLEYEKDKLSNQLEDKQVKVRELESELDGVRDGLRNQKEEYTSLEEKLQKLMKESECSQDQMRKTFDDERDSQDKIVAKIISEKEEALLCQRDMRSKLNSQTQEIAVRDSQLLELQAKLDESRQERDDLCAKYEDSRAQIASLLDKSLNSKDHANNLMAHYMEIEDDLRRQLQLVQDEKVGLERRLTIVQRESDRSLGNLCREKHSLTSTLESKEDSLLELKEHIEDLRKSKKESQEKMDELNKEVNYLKQSNREMYEQYEIVCGERDQLYNKAEKLISSMENSVSTRDVTVNELNSKTVNMAETSQKHVDTMETLQDKIHRITADREHLSCTVGILESYHEAHNATIKNLTTALEEERLSQKKKLGSLHGEIARMATEKDAFAQQIKDLTSKMASIEAEKLVHGNAMAEAQSVFDSELEHHQTKSKKLMEVVKKLHETIAEQGVQILQLKASLKDSLEEALRLGSKITSEQAKLLEVTHTMSSFEEENFKLKQSLEQSQSEVDGIATVLSTQELEQFDLKLSLEKTKSELSDKEKIVIETMNTVTHFQLKLARAEQERDTLSKGADTKITRLKNELSLLEKTKQEKEKSLMRKLARTEQERDAQSEGAHAEIARLKNDFTSLEKMQQEKEKYLMSQIVALKEDCEVGDNNDHLYRELLSKLDDKETYYNSRIRSMMNDIDSLKEEIKSLTEENNRLFRVNEGIIADYESLAVEKNMLSLANDHILFENSSLLENARLSAKEGDELSTKSGASRADHLNRTASELETTILAIKKHHSNTVERLQGELDDARSRLKKYQQKVKDLTVLIEENAFVIEALHRKLRGKKCNQNNSAGGAPPHLTRSRDNSLVSE